MELIGFKGVPDDPQTAGGIVGIDIDGHLRLGSPNFMPKFQHTEQFQYLNTTTWLRGRHQVKFGVDIMMPMQNEYFDVAPTRGNLRFQSTFTGHAFADFLIGYANRAELTNVFVVDQRLWSTAFYVQDDWRPNDNLTVTLGLRYDFMTPATEAENQLANFDPTANNGAGGLIFATDGSLADRALIRPDKNNFAPRIGAVYKLDERTLIRGGYGVFYNQFDRIGSEDQLALNPPGLRNIQVNSPSGATTPILRLQDGFPPNYLDPANLVIRNLKLRAATVEAPRTMVQQFGAGIERQFGTNFVLSADAVGSITSNLAVLRNLNQPLPGTLDANGAIPFPNFGNIQAREMTGEANYKGVDFSFEKRLRDGYSYRLSYTLSETRDQAPEHLAASSGRAQNTRDLESWEGPSDFDVRHRLVGNFIYELPFGPDRRVPAGWRGQSHLRRVALQRHLQRAIRACIHGDPGKQQRGCRPNRLAEPHR